MITLSGITKVFLSLSELQQTIYQEHMKNISPFENLKITTFLYNLKTKPLCVIAKVKAI